MMTIEMTDNVDIEVCGNNYHNTTNNNIFNNHYIEAADNVVIEV